MERPHLVLSARGWAAVLLCAILSPSVAAAAQPAPEDSRPLQQVQVTGSKPDLPTLKRIAIQFVQFHAVVSPVIQQFSRWRIAVCSQVTGLNPADSEFVTRRVEEVAQSVGAPTPRAGKECKANVEIVFTAQPQEILEHIAKASPLLLGSSRSAGDTTIHRVIQSWYLTGTMAVNGVNPPVGTGTANSQSIDLQEYNMDMLVQAGVPAPFLGGVRVDLPGGGAPSGLAGSLLNKGLASEILHVLIIVDGRNLDEDSLPSFTDYIAMLALTRMGSLDSCGELPSIIDLLSSGCGARDKPHALTDADMAYLKALYSSDLEVNGNIELGDMRDRMVTTIAGR